MPDISDFLDVDSGDVLDFFRKAYPDKFDGAVLEIRNKYLQLEQTANEELRKNYAGKLFLCRDRFSLNDDEVTFKVIIEATAHINITYHKCFEVYYNVVSFKIERNENGLLQLKIKGSSFPCAGYLESFESRELMRGTFSELHIIGLNPTTFNSVEEAELFLNLNDDWRDKCENSKNW